MGTTCPSPKRSRHISGALSRGNIKIIISKGAANCNLATVSVPRKTREFPNLCQAEAVLHADSAVGRLSGLFVWYQIWSGLCRHSVVASVSEGPGPRAVTSVVCLHGPDASLRMTNVERPTARRGRALPRSKCRKPFDNGLEIWHYSVCVRERSRGTTWYIPDGWDGYGVAAGPVTSDEPVALRGKSGWLPEKAPKSRNSPE